MGQNLPIMLANKEDNPTYQEAMYGPNKAGFIAAMGEEMLIRMELEVYDLVNRTPDMKVIPGVWDLRCKRYPDGLLKMLKARYCARGYKQVEGVDYFETYSPVVMWMTV